MEDESLLCTVTEDKGYLKMLDRIEDMEDDDKQTGMVTYKDSKDVEQVIVYCNIPQRNWVFALKDTDENVYGSLNNIKKVLAIVCVVMAIIVIVILNIILSSIGRKLKLISNSIKKLVDMELTANKMLELYSGQRDEIGIVCNALVEASYAGDAGRGFSVCSRRNSNSC